MTARATRKSQDSKADILAAAIEVIRRAGAPSLTIDAVAEESGFSKGGVLYNFPTKDALITGMVEFLVGQFEADVLDARTRNLTSRSPTLSGMYLVWRHGSSRSAHYEKLLSLALEAVKSMRAEGVEAAQG